MADVDNLIKLATANQQQKANESAFLYNDQLFLEDDANGGNNPAPANNGNQNQPANNQQNQKTIGNQDSKDSLSGKINENPNKPNGGGNNNVQQYAKRVTSTVATLMSIRIAAAERFASDFYKIIKQHVKYYEGDNGNNQNNNQPQGNQDQQAQPAK